MSNRSDRIIRRRFEDITWPQVVTLAKRIKMKKYRFAEVWLEVEETTGRKDLKYLKGFSEKNQYFTATLFYKSVDLSQI